MSQNPFTILCEIMNSKCDVIKLELWFLDANKVVINFHMLSQKKL